MLIVLSPVSPKAFFSLKKTTTTLSIIYYMCQNVYKYVVKNPAVFFECTGSFDNLVTLLLDLTHFHLRERKMCIHQHSCQYGPKSLRNVYTYI